MKVLNVLEKGESISMLLNNYEDVESYSLSLKIRVQKYLGIGYFLRRLSR